ncbi:hypothetical protein [Paenibacillus agaridevorans]|uniref:hypothetical protein n=1 Tax=Paenibacillus agaridevorans TaxID=171404 RepID=UPI001BE493FF|nr:hypothetical protein [Paenibacillus agaridevorans]
MQASSLWRYSLKVVLTGTNKDFFKTENAENQQKTDGKTLLGRNGTNLRDEQ